jgi:hypothetical protein
MKALPTVLEQLRAIRERTAAKLDRLDEAIKMLELMVDDTGNGQAWKRGRQQSIASPRRTSAPTVKGLGARTRISKRKE